MADNDANTALEPAPIITPRSSAPGANLGSDPNRRDNFSSDLLSLLKAPDAGGAAPQADYQGGDAAPQIVQALPGTPQAKPGQQVPPPPPQNQNVQTPPQALQVQPQGQPGQQDAPGPGDGSNVSDPTETWTDEQYHMMMATMDSQSKNNLDLLGAAPQALGQSAHLQPNASPPVGVVQGAIPNPSLPGQQNGAFPSPPQLAQAAPQTVELRVEDFIMSDAEFDSMTMSKSGMQKLMTRAKQEAAKETFQTMFQVMDTVIQGRVGHILDAQRNSEKIMNSVPGMKNYENQVFEQVAIARQQNPGVTMDQLSDMMADKFSFANQRFDRIQKAKKVDVVDRQRGQFAPPPPGARTPAATGAVAPVPVENPIPNSAFSNDTMGAFASIAGLQHRRRERH